MSTTTDQLRQNCHAIARQLGNDAENAASDFLDNALSIEYTVDVDLNFLGAEILVAFGGPTIWVNTRSDMIEGSWGFETVKVRFNDENDLHGMCEEMFDVSLRR